MKINELIPDNKIVLVDADKYRAQKLMAELNAEQIENMVQNRFLDYVKDSGVELCFSINGVERIVRWQAVFCELNYDERGFDVELPTALKYDIASKALDFLNSQVESHAQECKELVEKEWKGRARYWKGKVRMWKQISLILALWGTISLFIISFCQ